MPEFCALYLEEDIVSWFVSTESFAFLGKSLALIGTIFVMIYLVPPMGAGIYILGLCIMGYILSQSCIL